MFGLFKKKKSLADAQFEAQLLTFTVDFSHVINAIDPQGADELMSRAFNNYYKRDAREQAYSASDFYFDAFTGVMFESMEKSILSPRDSLRVFSMVDSFLRGNPGYQTKFVLDLMQMWQNRLINFGVIKI